MEVNEELISEAEKIRIAAIDDVRARQESTEEYRLYRRIIEDRKVAVNYEIFNVQCKINELLNDFVKYIKNYRESANETYRIYNNSCFYELIDETNFNNYFLQKIAPTIDTEVIDKDNEQKLEERTIKRNRLASGFYKHNMNDLRNFLFYCHGISPLPIPKQEINGSIDVLECKAAGVNPEAYIMNSDKWFLEQKDYTISDITNIVINTELYGIETASRIKDNKKLTNIIR